MDLGFIVLIVLSMLGFTGFLVLLMYVDASMKRQRLLIINPDHTGKLFTRNVQNDGKQLSIKGNAWEVNDKTHKVVLDSWFGKSTLHIVSPQGIEPLRINANSIETQPIDPATFSKNTQNNLMRQILANAKSDSLNTKVILILALGIVAVIVAYFVFVAPNMIPKDAAIQLSQAVANATVNGGY